MAEERSANLAKNKKVKEHLLKVYKSVEAGFDAQKDRADKIKDLWDLYNCKLGPKQLFAGRNELFAPIVYNAVQARATRFSNQLFPQNGRHIECVSTDGTTPRAAIAVAEHYVGYAKLRELVPSLCIAGDVEGQYNVYVSWRDSKRFTTRRVKRPIKEDGFELGDVDDVEESEESTSGPNVEIVPDTDVCILPATAQGPDDAIAQGGSVTVVRRWNKARVKQAVRDGDIDEKTGDDLIAQMDRKDTGSFKDMAKSQACAAGINKDGRGSWALVFETWTEVETEEGWRLCQVFFGGPDNVLMARRNPLWCDELPILSVPVKRISGSAKGRSVLAPVADLQYYANDVLNEAADASNYALLPIILRDPENSTAPLVLAPGAIWDVGPSNVQFAQFPPLWKEGLEIVSNIQAQIMQTLAVTPAMVTMGTKKKLNQAEVAQEQQIDLLTTSDSVKVIEEGILSPLMRLFMHLDYQYRDKVMLVRQYGEMGMSAIVEEVPPLQVGTRYTFRWIGVEAGRSAQQTQQKIAAMNILRGIPPQMYPGYTLDAQPVIVDLVETAFGPQLGRLVLKDMRSQMSVAPDKENELLDMGHVVSVHPMDNHQEHMQVHSQSLQTEGDAFGLKMIHLVEHQRALVQQQMAMAAAMQGGGPAPGVPNQTPPGAQPRPPQGAQSPPGMIQQDQMKDPAVFPRRAG